MRKSFALFLLFCLPVAAFAQCDNCPSLNTKPDFCYTHEEMPDNCVMFVGGEGSFYYSLDRKTVLKLTLPAEGPTLDYLLSLVDIEKKLELKDLLLIHDALPAWDTASLYVGFKTLPSGLGYKMEDPGTGPKPRAGQTVVVHYKGYLADGTEFDNTYDNDQPVSFTLGAGQVVEGWDQGVAMFGEGGKGTLLVPPNLGYGSSGYAGLIPPNAHIFFDIELVAVK